MSARRPRKIQMNKTTNQLCVEHGNNENRHPDRKEIALASAAYFASVAGIVVLTVFSLVGCADMSGIKSTASLRNAEQIGLPVASTMTEARVDAEWWKQFGNPQLDSLVEEALKNNPNLAIARARLTRAQAVKEVADASLLPQVGAALDATHQRYTANGAVPPPLAGSIRDSATLNFNLSWEIDFFGKNRAALDAALGAAQAADADVQSARVLLAAQVARGYFQIVRLNEQLALAERTLTQREQVLTLVRDRVNAGLDTRLELRQSEGTLPEARQQAEAYREQKALAINALTALVGNAAFVSNATMQQQIDTAMFNSLKTPVVPTLLPANLLAQRADINAARWRVEVANRDQANAKAQFYPNINLVAFAGLSSIGLNNFVDSGSQQWGVGPAIRLPIFEGGRLRANLSAKSADLDAAIESYNASVLDAVRDVADAVASSQSITRQQIQQRDAAQAAESAFDIATQRYKAGLGTYLQVLTAETGVIAQRRLEVDLAARAIDNRANLMRALGGGYVPSSEPQLAQANP